MTIVATASLGRASSREDAQARRDAAGSKALAILYSALNHEDPDTRVLSAEQWGLIGNRAAVPVLRRALSDPNPYVRIAAAGSLYQLGDSSGVAHVEAIVAQAPKAPAREDALGALEQMRAIAHNKVRVVAIRALSLMGKTSSVEVLRTALRDKDGAVRDAAATALARLGVDDTLERFVSALEDEDPAVRAKAVGSLGEVATPATVNYLKPFAEDPSYQVRAAVMSALGETASVLALPELLGGLKDQNELVRAKAAAALGRIESPSAIAPLQECLRTAPSVYFELLATAGLARLGQTVDVSAAQRSLAQPDADTRLLAVEVLETVGGDAAVENLEFALEDLELRVRVRAAAALVKLTQRKAPPEGGGRD